MFGKAIGCNYLAGHWELGLIESIDWRGPLPYMMASHTDTTPVAPSWSMALVNGQTYKIGFHSSALPVADFLGASSRTGSHNSTALSAQCRLRFRSFAYRMGTNANEVICGVGHKSDLYFSVGTKWLPGYWRPFP